jgi:hypothetical protein
MILPRSLRINLLTSGKRPHGKRVFYHQQLGFLVILPSANCGLEWKIHMQYALFIYYKLNMGNSD